MNVSLTAELEKYIAEKIASGMYLTASEVVRDALRMLKNQDEVNEVRLQQLREEIAKGLKSLDEGRKVVFDERTVADIKARGRSRLAGEKKAS